MSDLVGYSALRAATLSDLDALTDLEARSYPVDEAATRETLRLRLEKAAEYTTVRERERALIGFVCGTLAAGEHLTASSMHEHDPSGSSLCIHSVVIDPLYRRHGLGRALMLDYVEYVRRHTPRVQCLLLIAKQHLVGFYQQVGFELVGPSPVQHGRDSWFELRLELER